MRYLTGNHMNDVHGRSCALEPAAFARRSTRQNSQFPVKLENHTRGKAA